MLSLTINGSPAIVKDGTTFKLTRPNPLLTSASSSSTDYTMEIQLPLDGCAANWAIFAKEGATPAAPAASLLPLVGKTWAAKLCAPPLTIDGTAKLTSVSDGTAKVQFTARLALTDNLTPEQEATYIDTLPLGYCFKDACMPPVLSAQVPYYGYGNRQGPGGGSPAGYETRSLTWVGDAECYDAGDESVRQFLRHAFCFQPAIGVLTPDDWDAGTSGTWATKIMYGSPEETDSVLFPVEVDEASFGEEDPETAYTAVLNLQNGTRLAPEVAVHDTTTIGGKEWKRYSYTPAAAPISPQPYLMPLLRDVFACFGFAKGDWSFYEESKFFSGLICVSPVIDNVRRARCLPHWTLSELITEVQNFFQCLIVVRTGEDGTKLVDLVPLAAYSPAYSGKVPPLVPVAEFQEATVEDTSAVSTAAAGNVCYDLEEANAQTALPLSALTTPKIKDFSTLSALQAAAGEDYAAGTHKDKLYRLTPVCDEDWGACVTSRVRFCVEWYAWLRAYTTPTGSDLSGTWQLSRVNVESAIWRDTTDDSQNKLRIVPCQSCALHGGAALPSAVPPSGYLASGSYYTDVRGSQGAITGYDKVDFLTDAWCAAAPYSRPALRDSGTSAGYTGSGSEFAAQYRHALRLPKTYAVYKAGYSLSADVQESGADASSKYQTRLYLAHYDRRAPWRTLPLLRPVWQAVSGVNYKYNKLAPVSAGEVTFPQPSAMDGVRELWTDSEEGSGLTNFYSASLPPEVMGYSRFALGQEVVASYGSKEQWPYYAADLFRASAGSVNGRLIRRYTLPAPYARRAVAGTYAEEPLTPTAPYTIDGRPLVCQKIEYTVGPSGIVPPLTAYFAEWQS